MTRNLFIYWYVVLTALLLPGCMEEKGGNCEVEVTLTYVYELHYNGGDLFDKQVEHLSIYVYDQQGTWVQEKEIPVTDLTDGNSVTLTLDTPGTYTFVTWGNIHTDDFILETPQTAALAKLKLACQTEEGVLTRTDPGLLFHNAFTLQTNGGRKYTEKVSLTKNSNLIRVEIDGVKDPANTQLEIVIAGHNHIYASDNTLYPEAPEVIYISEQWIEGGYICAYIPTYRLFSADTDLRLSVRSIEPTPEGIVYTYNKPLIPILLQDATTDDHQLYLDKKDEFDLYISFDEDGVGNASTVRPWEDVDDNQDL